MSVTEPVPLTIASTKLETELEGRPADKAASATPPGSVAVEKLENVVTVYVLCEVMCYLPFSLFPYTVANMVIPTTPPKARVDASTVPPVPLQMYQL